MPCSFPGDDVADTPPLPSPLARYRTVYLCGAINGCSDAVATGWRERAKADPVLVALGAKFLDPMRRDYRGREAESVREIIAGDVEDIHRSSVVLAMCDVRSWGTAMEVYLAHTSGKQVVVVCSNPRPSPWLVGHSAVLVPTLEAGLGAVAAFLSGSPVPRDGLRR